MSITNHHARTAGHPRGEKAGVITQRRVVGMRLDVRLCHDIQAVLVAQVEECRVVGVVAGAHRVAVMAFHRNNVVSHVVNRHCLAAHGVVIVAIHTANRDAPAINANLAMLHPDAPETRH